MLKQITKKIEQELRSVLDKVSEKDTTKLVGLIIKSKAIFLLGRGRSGLVAKAFAMRLMQLGLTSYVVGEATTPSLKKNNLLIAISGSGKTKSIVNAIKGAKIKKAKVCLITANKPSKKLDLIVEIKAKTKLTKRKSIEPLGSLFEQAAFIYLDSIVILLMKKLGRKEKYLKKKHAKIE